jgi:Flp pilus assembly protein TadG
MVGRTNSQRAQALIEMAIVLPVFLMLVLGIVDFGMALRSYITVTNSSREGARYAIVCPSTTSDDPIKNRVADYSNGLVKTDDVSVTWQTPTERCKSGNYVKVQAATDYTYITPLGSLLPGPLHLSASATMRAE